MEYSVQLELSPEMAGLQVVDEHRGADPTGTTFLGKSAEGQELASGIDDVVDREDPIRSGDEVATEAELEVAVLIVAVANVSIERAHLRRNSHWSSTTATSGSSTRLKPLLGSPTPPRLVVAPVSSSGVQVQAVGSAR